MTSERRKPYPFDQIESKWQRLWDERQIFHAPNPGDKDFDPHKPKFYVLDMFPYPSGAGLHVGHPEGYTATDIIARYKRLCGFNVLHPMGWDAFGLPAEQYAIRTGQHPAITTRENIAKFKSQLKAIGFSYDWQREINTTDQKYFKWTQWIFLKIYNSWLNPETNKAEPISTYRGDNPDSVRLAYVADVPVNWCPELGTVLANEEVIDGKSEIGGHPVVRRPMRQWMLRITAYAERLIDELDGLDWPEGIKLLQRNWIGKSEGAEIEFSIEKHPDKIRVFTTRHDTIYGANYMVLAPEHPLVDALSGADRRSEVVQYRADVAAKSDLERTDLAKEKTGVFIGAYAINPVTQAKMPIWIADYVLLGYGTGAVMGVPGHDERDLEFARKFNLPVLPVVQAPGKTPEESIGFVDDGIAVNSPIIDGLPTPGAKRKMLVWLEQNGVGRADVRYKLRDWLFSRQRYWGEPFPIIWEEDADRHRRHRSLGEGDLPVIPPPLDDYKPTGTGEPPLAKAKEWVRYSDQAMRETNVMPQWAGSCWYYLRFCDPHNDERFVGQEAERYWMGAQTKDEAGKQKAEGSEDSTFNHQPSTVPAAPGGVDLYVGGTEHAVLHLLYARFWHKVLFDLGYLSKSEPFQRLVNQGIILGEDNQKMSKSRGNIVNPDDVIDLYGADSFRCYEMFMGPLEQMKPWSMRGVEGVSRFLARVWRLVMTENQAGEWELSAAVKDVEPTREQNKVLHATIKKVTADIESLSFNTAISQMMIFVNAFIPRAESDAVPVSAMRTFLLLLNPFAPHLASELWETLKSTGEITAQKWPNYDESILAQEDVEMVIQVNGKLRATIRMPVTVTEEEAKAAALAHPKIQSLVNGMTIRKVVFVPKRLVNLVVN